MNNEAINWDDVPDRITKDQLYRICHISKSTARYLLQSGKIPCYYASLLASYRDVLTAAEVCKLTGYSKTAVNNWCGSGILKAFKRSNVNHIPKVYLIEFLCSPDCRSITRKSDWHIWTLKRFPAWRRQKQAEGGAE